MLFKHHIMKNYISSLFCKGDISCADPESFVRGGPTLTTSFFSLMRGGRIQIPLLTGHQRPASETPFKWRFAGGPMIAQHGMLAWYFVIFQGIPTSIAKEPYCFVIFQGGGGPVPLPPPPLDPHMCINMLMSI